MKSNIYKNDAQILKRATSELKIKEKENKMTDTEINFKSVCPPSCII